MNQPLNIWKCETAQQSANLCAAEALAIKHGATFEQITDITVDANGDLASIGLGTDEDGMGRFILNFAL